MAQEINSLQMLLNEELKDMYDMEKQLTKALPKMAKKAQSEELRSAIEEHLEVTNQHVERLEQVFELLGQAAKTKTCAGMKGLIEEGKEVMDQDATEPFGDAALIGAAQRVEHYEIAAYGTARTLAETLGNSEAAELLQQTLDEEKEADEKLTEICETLLENVGEEMGEESEEQEEGAGKRGMRMMPGTQRSSGRRTGSEQQKRRAG